MHPPFHDQSRYSADVHQGPILVSGVPNPNPIHPYAPHMAMRHVRVVAGKWPLVFAFAVIILKIVSIFKTSLDSPVF